MVTTVSAKINSNTAEGLDALALAWSEKLGREVSRSEVIRTLLVKGVEGHPVDDDIVARAQAGERFKAPAKPKAEPRLRIVSLDEEGDTSPRGFDLRLVAETCPRGQGAPNEYAKFLTRHPLPRAA